MFPSRVVFLLCLYTGGVSSTMCTILGSVSVVQQNTAMYFKTFLTINSLGIMDCAKQCMLRRRCRSFNFDPVSLTCDLNSEDTSQSPTAPSIISSYSEIDDWSEMLMGECANHNCAINEKCEVTGTGVNACVLIGCLAPSVANGGLIGFQTVWDFGEEAIIFCIGNYEQGGDLLCQIDGTWSNGLCEDN